jgi:hypothetical protein
MATAAVGTAEATTFVAGQYVTYTQQSYGATPAPGNGAQFVTDHFLPVYGASGLEVGVPGNAGFSMSFTDAINIVAYLPATGSPGPLNSDHTNATSTAAGEFGGDVLALRLNVDFADAGLLGSAPVHFGDLVLGGYGIATLDGLTVRQFLADAELALGANTSVNFLAALATVSSDLNQTFALRVPSSYAELHLAPPPAAVPEPGSWSLMIVGFALAGTSIRKRKITVGFA